MARIFEQLKCIPIPMELLPLCQNNKDYVCFLAQLVYWTERKKDSKWIYKTALEWQKELYCSENMYRGAKKFFQELGIIEIKVKKDPRGTPKCHFRIIEEKLKEFIQQTEHPPLTRSTRLREPRPNNNIEYKHRLQVKDKSFTKGVSKETQKEKLLKGLQKSGNSLIKREAEVLKIPRKYQVYFDLFYKSRKYSLTAKRSFDSLDKIKKLFSGTLFKQKFTEENLLAAMTNFLEAMENTDCFPTNKICLKRLSLGEFIFNPRTKIQSHFLYYLENKPKLINSYSCKNSELAKAVQTAYKKKILNDNAIKLTNNDMIAFEKAADNFTKFFTDKQDNIRSFYFKNHNDIADTMVNCLKRFMNGSTTPPPYYLSGKLFFEKFFPLYCFEQGILKEKGNQWE